MIPGSESYPVLEEAAIMAGSQYDATFAIRGGKRTCVHRNRLGFYSILNCIYTLCGIVNHALVLVHLVTLQVKHMYKS